MRRSMIRIAHAALAAAAALTAALPAQPGVGAQKTKSQKTKSEEQKRGAKQDAGQSARALVEKMLAKEGIKIDKKKGLVQAEGKITVTRDFLGFVAIGPSGKKHEALVMLRCRGSSLNAALLALGLVPGKNADFVEIVPRPTLEEYEAGAPLDRLIKPKGPRLYLSVSWHDKDDKLIEKRVEDLIIDVTTEKPLENAKWLYVKALVASIEKGKPPVFVADYEGNFIATYYAKPDTHFVTIDHERARDDANWYANTAALPPAGTDCTLTLSTKPRLPGDKAEKAKPAKGAKKSSDAKKPGGAKKKSVRDE